MATSRIVLTADDYAMTGGVTAGILELAERGRIAATSAFVTTPHWTQDAPRLAAVRDRVAAGLHLNLTLGAPVGPMPKLAPGGRLPSIGDLTAEALKGRIDTDEIAAETTRQLERFEAAMGFAPDHVDGHQHAHALPGVRDGVIAALAARRYARPPLVRDPTDSLRSIFARGGRAIPKAMALSWLSRGFGTLLRAAGFPTNDSFAGVTDFDPASAVRDFAAAGTLGGPLHLVMCHPGHVDAELRGLDPVTTRRAAELEALAADPYAGRLWRPSRSVDGPPVDWAAEREAVR